MRTLLDRVVKLRHWLGFNIRWEKLFVKLIDEYRDNELNFQGL